MRPQPTLLQQHTITIDADCEFRLPMAQLLDVSAVQTLRLELHIANFVGAGTVHFMLDDVEDADNVRATGTFLLADIGENSRHVLEFNRDAEPHNLAGRSLCILCNDAAVAFDLTVRGLEADAENLAAAIDVAAYSEAQVVVLFACDRKKPTIESLPTGWFAIATYFECKDAASGAVWVKY